MGVDLSMAFCVMVLDMGELSSIVKCGKVPVQMPHPVVQSWIIAPDHF